MKNSTRILTLLIAGVFFFGTAVYAGNDDAQRTGFVDLNGDGINDNMKDANGDGIPDQLAAGDDGNTYMNAYQSKEQAAEHYQLTFHWRTHEMSKELFQYQYQYGALGDGGQVNNQNASKGSGDTGDKGGK